MRDINNGRDINVGGNFNITTNSQSEHKLLVHCSNEELLQERPFRQENIEIEQERKIKRLMPFYFLTVFLFGVAAIMAWVSGRNDIVTLALGLGSLAIGFISIKLTFVPNTFQIEEQNVVREINKILRQRRVE